LKLAEARDKAKRLLLEKSAPTRVTVGRAIDIFEAEYLNLRNRASTARETARAHVLDSRTESVSIAAA